MSIWLAVVIRAGGVLSYKEFASLRDHLGVLQRETDVPCFLWCGLQFGLRLVGLLFSGISRESASEVALDLLGNIETQRDRVEVEQCVLLGKEDDGGTALLASPPPPGPIEPQMTEDVIVTRRKAGGGIG